jgi:hypothetical protein
MQLSHVFKRALALALVLGLSACQFGENSPLDEPVPSDYSERLPLFGYRAMATGPVGQSTERPLLAIMLRYRDLDFFEHHTPSFYSSLLSGPTRYPNLRDFFLENSKGRFTTNSQVVGPFTRRDNPRTRDDESLAECYPPNCPDSDRARETDCAEAVRMASEAGFDFAAYDSNQDGVVSSNELMILVIGATRDATSTGGAIRIQSVFPFKAMSVWVMTLPAFQSM